MTSVRILTAIALLGLIGWLGWGAWLVGRDLWRRWKWNRKHYRFGCSEARYMATWKKQKETT